MAVTLRRAGAAIPNAPSPADEDLPADRLDLSRLSRQYEQIPRTAQNEDDATQQFVRLSRHLLRASAVLYYGLDSAHQVHPDPCGRSPDDLSEFLPDQLFLIARRTQDVDTAQVVQMSAEPPRVAIAVPVPLRDGQIEVLVVVQALSGHDRQQVAWIVEVAQLLAAFAGQWRGCFNQVQAAGRAVLLQKLVLASSRAIRAGRVSRACEAFADFLEDHWRAQLVAIALRRRGDTCRVQGMSHEHSGFRGAPLVTAIEAVLSEGLSNHNAGTIERLNSAEPKTEALGQLQLLLDSQELYRVVLRDGLGQPQGALLIVRDELLVPSEQMDLQEACDFIGPCVDQLRRTRIPWWKLGRSAYKQLTPTQQRVAAAVACAVALVLFAIPFPSHVKCRCDVQAVTRHFVGAPYEGRLQDALVEPGDVVHAGQILAIMDGHEIRLELSGLEAELQRVTKQRDRALANRETSAAQIALLEMQRLQVQIQLQEERLENLEIRSPTEGVVLSGDPKKLKGARLTIGQTLLEVGLMGKMELEVAIPDDRVAQVVPDSPVRFRLDAMPRTTFHGRLRGIHPRSEQREAQNVFIGEVQIQGEPTTLKPGMRGHAKLSAGRRSLFGLMFSRAIDQLVFYFGW